MAIPDYQTCMLPLLKVIADGSDHKMTEVVVNLSQQFKLTQEEQDALLPSGQQSESVKIVFARFHS